MEGARAEGLSIMEKGVRRTVFTDEMWVFVLSIIQNIAFREKNHKQINKQTKGHSK